MRSSRPSLIGKLGDPANRGAWEDFYRQYHARIVHWGQGRGLQREDAEDVAQQLLERVWNYIPQFHYDPDKGSFCGWLWTLWNQTYLNWLRANRRRYAALPEDASLTDTVKEYFAREEFLEACVRAQIRCHERDWQIFLAGVCPPDGQIPASIPELAQRNNLSEGRVANILSEIKKLVEEQLGILRCQAGDS